VTGCRPEREERCVGRSHGAGLAPRAARLAFAVVVGALLASAPASALTPTAPSRPPLVSSTTTTIPTPPDRTGGDEPSAGGSPQAELDPLVSNGLGSPLCERAVVGSELSGASRRDCESSGFVAAAAPTGNFGLDVHIDTGLLGLSSAGLLAIVQDLFVTPVWMALVWVVHALIVMLEWCFTIDLLDSGSVANGVARGLREMQAAITAPWLATALAIASVLCAYNGLIRRRVVESLTQALLAVAMVAAAVWVMVDPTGTVGTVGGWANRAGLGTLAVSSQGDPSSPERALANGMNLVFSATIEVPWCYLEFGDVDWCTNPSRLDPQLHAAALGLAVTELKSVGCADLAAPQAPCTSHAGAEARALEHSARSLREARTNGAIFLALPPNGPARNAINDPASLLRAICLSDDATDCHGAAAAQAEFRTNHGTWPRVAGLLLIVAGALGMLLLLGFLALRLLGSAIFSLLYLMLAPVAALAPALGDAGRAAFRKWAAHLLGALVSKLLFAFLLGVVLAILGTLEHLEGLGWWTRWLLMSAFWWGLFVRRHQALALTSGGRSSGSAQGSHSKARRRAGEALGASARAQRRVREAKERFSKRAPEVDARSSFGYSRRADKAASSLQTRPSDDGRAAERLPVVGHDGTPDPSPGRPDRAGDREAQPSRGRGSTARPRQANDADGVSSGASVTQPARLGSLVRQRDRALEIGNRRRAARLASRAQRIESETRSSSRVWLGGREYVAAEREARHARFLGAQFALPATGEPRAPGPTQERSYAALAGLAGYGSREYRQLDPPRRWAARLQIDRELTRHRERALTEGQSTANHPRTAPKAGRPATTAPSESVVMRDAREIAARRKRQLERERP
jgi:hypothetical protein